VLVCYGSLGHVFFFSFGCHGFPYVGIAAGEVEVLAV
jgi:hypothetical protein